MLLKNYASSFLLHFFSVLLPAHGLRKEQKDDHIGPFLFPGFYDYEVKINSFVFPGLQGGPQNHTIAGLAVALKHVSNNFMHHK